MKLDWKKIPADVTAVLSTVLNNPDCEAKSPLAWATPAQILTTIQSILDWSLSLDVINHTQKDVVLAFFQNTPPQEYEWVPNSNHPARELPEIKKDLEAALEKLCHPDATDAEKESQKALILHTLQEI